MLILLSNDDGIQAAGLEALRLALNDIAEVVVVAPDRERSAAGHSITVYHPIRVDEFCFTDTHTRGWVADGTPADCVKLAICSLLDRTPDLVISGINRGGNLGTDVLYSGTVSAALEGAVLGVPSMAVSLNSFDFAADYTHAAEFTKDICLELFKKPLPTDLLLNINFPAVPRESVQGAVITKLGIRRYDDVFTQRQDPRGRNYYWLAGAIVDEVQDEDTDVMVIKRHKISITPLHYDLTHYQMMDKMNQQLQSFLKS